MSTQWKPFRQWTQKHIRSRSLNSLDSTTMPTHRLLVLSGPSESLSALRPTAPNPPTEHPPTRISESLQIKIHIRSFTGYPSAQTATPTYFTVPPHTHDNFSVYFHFTPPVDIPGPDLVIVNTFSSPIRDSLPYFFPIAWRAFTTLVDPGVTGDPLSDAPEFGGPVLSSAKQLSCYCPPEDDNSPVVEESMPDDVPDTSSKRRKWFLDQERLNAWVWRKGRVYRWDFCSGLMDFNDFSVGLPGVGFRIHVMKYWDGQPLRWELKNRRTGEVYGVVQLEPEEEGSGSEEGEEKNEELD